MNIAVVCTGTFLRGRVIIGDVSYESGPDGMHAASALTESLEALGLSLRLCDLFAIGFTLIVPLGKWLLRFLKAHKHDAPKEAVAPENDTNESNDTEQKSA